MLLLCALAAGHPGSAVAQGNSRDPVAVEVADLHRRVNRHREAVGCAPLKWHEGAAGVAEAHSADMSRRDYFDHVSPDGVDLSHRLLEAGVTWRQAIAENIALTVRGPETVIELWVSSPPHRANLEDCSFTHEGIGLFRDRWTQVLIGSPGG